MQKCRSEVEWRQLLAGDLPPRAETELSAHLDRCRPCSRLVDRLQDADSVAALIRAVPSSDREPLPPDLAERARGLRRRASQEESWRASSSASPLLAAEPTPAGVHAEFGPFRLVRRLGSGGMGIVWEAVETALERRVALKVIQPEIAGDPDSRARFLQEARAAAAVVSDHIVSIYQVGEIEGTPYLTMPLLPGQTLHRWLASGRRATVAESMHIVREAAKGLAAAHAAGLVHRDVKPANLWLEAPKGRVKLLDFGLARPAAGGSQTHPGFIIGTPGYLSPEQCRGEKVTGRSDVFALGVILHELLTGQPPFPAKDTVAQLLAVAIETPPAATQLNDAVPPELARLGARMLAKEPLERPSAEEVAAELRLLERRLRSAAAPPAPDALPGLASANVDTEAPPRETQREGRGAPRKRQGAQATPPARRWRWAAAAGLAVLALLGGAALRSAWPTATPPAGTPPAATPMAAAPAGKLVVYVPGPPVPVKALRDGKEVGGTLATPKGGVIELPAGIYQLKLAEKDQHLEVVSPEGGSQAEVKPGESAAVHLRPKDGRPPPNHAPGPPPEHGRPPGRPPRGGPPP